MFYSRLLGIELKFAIVCLSLITAQGSKETIHKDFPSESVVIEQIKSKVSFQNDGTYVSERHVRVRIQSDAGVQQYSVLSVPYDASSSSLQISNVEVTKPDGTVVATDLSSIQDAASQVSKVAPMYTDTREKQLPVKGLEPGDSLQYSLRLAVDRPLIPNQFWMGAYFVKSNIVLDEEMEVNVPRERSVNVKSQILQPATRLEGDRRIFSWKRSNLESQSEDRKRAFAYDAIRGLLPAPDVLISSFQTWEEVGRWYGELQREKVAPSPEVKAKAEELTKGLTDDGAKIRAIYNYVSLRFRYISISFGSGRYQPHAAAEVLQNLYGDCKDKHTLLASLLGAAGIRAYPALINGQSVLDDGVPSPGQFNHVITVIPEGAQLLWLDTTPEVAPMGYLTPTLRGKPALVITQDKIAFQTTPAVSLIPATSGATLTATLAADGGLRGHVEIVARGDYAVSNRIAFRRMPESQWKSWIQRTSYAAHLGGTISNVTTSPPEDIDNPFTESYDYTLSDFVPAEKKWFVVPLPQLNLPTVKDEDLKREIPLWLGSVGESDYESRIELPKGWTAHSSVGLDIKEKFGEFQGTTEVRDGVVITKRSLILKTNAVEPGEIAAYRTFQKAIAENHNLYIRLYAPSTSTVP
jgi:hypothetical protein